METQSQNLLVKKFEESCTVWNGNDFLPFLKQMGISIETYSLIMVKTRPFDLNDNIFNYLEPC